MSNRQLVGSRISFGLFLAALFLLVLLGLSGCGSGVGEGSNAGSAGNATVQASVLAAADLSPDGFTITAPTGALVTTAGTWTFGPATAAGGTQHSHTLHIQTGTCIYTLIPVCACMCVYK